MTDIFSKNYDRRTPIFANINLLGRCNINCYFCLGKDLPDHFYKQSYDNVHFEEWKNFDKFILFCQEHGVSKIYLTGQNTDPLLYQYLKELIVFLQDMGFTVGLRTNGYGAIGSLDIINMCKDEIGYSIMSTDHNINNRITGKYELPDWDYIIPRTTAPCRVSLVINRYNFIEVMDMLKYISKFDNVKYIQLRRVSTDTRKDELEIDAIVYEEVYKAFKENFGHQFRDTFYGAEVFDLFGKELTFWRTVKTDINSFNYYVDGVFTDEYFIIEGYLKQIGEYNEEESSP